jgi:hypothetical protein
MGERRNLGRGAPEHIYNFHGEVQPTLYGLKCGDVCFFLCWCKLTCGGQNTLKMTCAGSLRDPRTLVIV